MPDSVSVLSPAEAILRGPDPRTLTIAVLAPTSGAMGVTGPAILNAARLAAESATAGLDRQIDLVLVDAGRAPDTVAAELRTVIAAGAVQGVVGTHTSDVRIAVERMLAGSLPYVFTPPHELDRLHGDTIFLGTGPREQILAPLMLLCGRERVRRWALVGNDYVWPRLLHHRARRIIPSLGGEVVTERLVPVGRFDPDRLVGEVLSSRAEGVLVSLIGRDGIRFHRAFARAGAGERVVRLCTALDEACLLSVGGDEQGALFTAMPLFGDPDGPWDGVSHAYDERFGTVAPAFGAYAAGAHDGVQLLADLVSHGTTPPRTGDVAVRLARAEGVVLSPVAV